MVRDPVCSMELDETDGSVTATRYSGKEFFFCSRGCQRLFQANPEEFLLKARGSTRREFDLIIIGGGPAGLTAGVYASIQNIATLMITANVGGQAIDSSKIRNYMGFDFITGKELAQKFRRQLIQEHFVEHKIGRVSGVRSEDGKFDVNTAAGDTFRAATLIIATGMERRRLGVPGEQSLERRGVFYSATQGVGRFGGRDVAVVGGGNSALQLARDLSLAVRNVFLVSRGDLTGDGEEIDRVKELKNMILMTHSEVVEIQGKQKVEGVVVRNRKTGDMKRFPVAAVFIAIGYFPNTSMVKRLVRCNPGGEIIIEKDCSTSHTAIFAAGDVTDSYGKRVIIAAGEGAKAALAAHRFLLNRRGSLGDCKAC